MNPDADSLPPAGDWSPDRPDQPPPERRPAELGGASWLISAAVHLGLLVLLTLVVLGSVVEPPAPAARAEFQRVPPVADETISKQTPNQVKMKARDRQPVPVDLLQLEILTPETKVPNPQAHTTRGVVEANSNADLGSVGVNRSIGLDGAPAGPQGTDGGGWQNLAGPPGGPSGPQLEALHLGLLWLAEHQEADGRWDCGRHGGQAEERADVAVTALALLAFLSAGHTDTVGRFSENVARALAWLDRVQRPDGAYSPNNYAQGMATLAVAEATGMTGRPPERAQRAVNCLLSRQQPGGGWDYGDRGDPGRDRNDTSITCWAVMALKSATIAGLTVPSAAFLGVERHFGNVGADSQFAGTVAYAIQGGEVQAGGNAILAMTLLSRQYLGAARDHHFVREAADILREEGPQLNNLYKLYYATLAMFTMGEGYWEAWNEGLQGPLVTQQVRAEGDDYGSWDPAGRTYGGDGGRVYSTAMAVLNLEVYYRYLSVYEQR